MYIKANQTTLLERIKQVELQAFGKSFYGTLDVSNNTFDSYHNGNVVVPVDIEQPAVNNLMYNQGLITEDDTTKVFSSEVLFGSVTGRLLTLDGLFSYADALVQIEKFISRAKNNFYGAVLKSSNSLVNPFHPLVVSTILSTKNTTGNLYKVIMYFYHDRKSLDTKFSTKTASLPRVNANIDNLLRISTSKVKANLLNVLDVQVKEDSAVIKSYIPANINAPIDLNTTYTVVAHQFLTKGIMSPYYGSSLIKTPLNEYSKGIHIGPMRSVNISCSDINNSKVTRAEVANYNSVCTGSHNSGVLENLRVLSHANLSSPYNRITVFEGALAYVDACIDKSRALYKAAGLLPSYTPISYPESYFKADEVDAELYALYTTNGAAFMESLISRGMSPEEVAQLMQYYEEYAQRNTTNDTVSEPTNEPVHLTTMDTWEEVREAEPNF